MPETEVKFRNDVKIRVQAQIFTGRSLISTCVAEPGEIGTLLAQSASHDIYFKDGATGWELARKLGNEAKILTLSQHRERYIIT